MAVSVVVGEEVGSPMDAVLIDREEQWEAFVVNSQPTFILQSWAWGEFYQSLGKKIFRLGLVNGDKLVSSALFIKYTTRFGSFLYCPRGPIFGSEGQFKKIIAKARDIAASEGCLFLRLDPLLELNSENQKFFKNQGFQEAGNYIQPEADWVLEISKPVEELVSQMRETTRRYLRKEEKEGLSVISSTKTEDAAAFADLVAQTSARKGFSGQGETYYKKIVEALGTRDQIKLYKTLKDGQVLSMAMVLFYADTAYYVHGASAQHNTSPVAYSTHIQAITDAKVKGMGFYNFGGVVKEENFKPGHPWYGITFFKMGFGGFRREYLKAQDLPLRAAYSLYTTAEKGRTQLRRLIRGYSIY